MIYLYIAIWSLVVLDTFLLTDFILRYAKRAALGDIIFSVCADEYYGLGDRWYTFLGNTTIFEYQKLMSWRFDNGSLTFFPDPRPTHYYTSAELKNFGLVSLWREESPLG